MYDMTSDQNQTPGSTVATNGDFLLKQFSSKGDCKENMSKRGR